MHAQSLTEGGRSRRRDRRYLDTPMGQEADHYLSIKRRRLTDASYRGYEMTLAELAMFYPTHTLDQFMPPQGIELLERFLSTRWGDSAPRTYNKNLSILSDFFKWQAKRQRLLGDPTLPIEKARKSAFYRTTFTTEQKAMILATARTQSERLALMLLLVYGIRKGTLQAIKFHHFNPDRRHVALHTKGQKVQILQLPHPEIWAVLDSIEDAKPHHYLLPRQHLVRRPTWARKAEAIREKIALLELDLADAEAKAAWVKYWPADRIGEHGLHDWWYRCLAKAGIVDQGVTSGERMHKARHSAAQHILDTTGSMKTVQTTLGHESAQTSEQYVDWSETQQAASLAVVPLPF